MLEPSVCLPQKGASERGHFAFDRDNGPCGVPLGADGEALELFRKDYPGSFGMDNVLEVALCNANILLHPLPTLLSLSRIEFSKGEFYVYNEAYTPSVERAIEALDDGIRAILRKVGFPAPSCKALFEKRYGGPWDEMRAWFRSIGSKGPSGAKARYITEDVPRRGRAGLLNGAASRHPHACGRCGDQPCRCDQRHRLPR